MSTNVALRNDRRCTYVLYQYHKLFYENNGFGWTAVWIALTVKQSQGGRLSQVLKLAFQGDVRPGRLLCPIDRFLCAGASPTRVFGIPIAVPHRPRGPARCRRSQFIHNAAWCLTPPLHLTTYESYEYGNGRHWLWSRTYLFYVFIRI